MSDEQKPKGQPAPGQPGTDENAAGFLKTQRIAPAVEEPLPPADTPVDLSQESVAGEEDPGAGMEPPPGPKRAP